MIELKQMKKILILIIADILLGLSLGGLFFVAENKLREKKTINVQEIVPQLPVVENQQERVDEEKNAEVLDEKKQTVEAEESADLKTETNKTTNKFRFAIIGDTQRFETGNNSGGLQKAVENIKRQGVALVFSLGDVVSNCDDGCSKKIDSWKGALGSLSGKTYVIMGNHDRADGNKSDKKFQDAFNFPTNGPSGYSELVYSFDYENSHFVVLNSEKPEEHLINIAQRNWLEKDLSMAKKENIFVFFHEPAYPLSNKINESLDVNKKDRDALWDIFKKYNVTAVFSGHEHIHSRRSINNILQFIFGNTDSFDHDLPKTGADFSYKGKAFGIVEVDRKSIKVKTISVDGRIINEFAFTK